MTNDPQGRRPLPTLRDTIAQWPSPVCVLTGSDHVFAASSAAYARMAGGRDLLGRPFAEALPGLSRQGFVQRLDRVFQSGERVRGEAVPMRWDRDGSGTEQDGVVDRCPETAISRGGAETPERKATAISHRATEPQREKQKKFSVAFSTLCVSV